MGKLTNYLRRAVGLCRVYRRSRALTFLVDYSREARRLRRNPQESVDAAHDTGTWNFDTPRERAWQSHVLATVAEHTGKQRWGDALEVGCSEGVFTTQLSIRCLRVTAYDISPLAIARARERCGAYSNVRIVHGDAASEEIEGRYDLVFVMDVLWSVVGRSRRATILANLANAVRDGGWIVFSDSRMPKGFRHALWSVVLPTGADAWAKLLGRAPGFNIVHKEEYSYSQIGQPAPEYWDKLFVLFRKERETGV